MAGLSAGTGLSPTAALSHGGGVSSGGGLSGGGGGPVYDSSAQAYFTAVAGAGGTLSSTDKTNYNTYIVALKTAGVWSLLDYNFMAAPNQIATNIDLVGLVTGTPVAAPTWTASQGYAGNGTSSYFNTNFTLSAGSNAKQNSAHCSAYTRTSRVAAQSSALIGTDNGSTGEFYIIPNFGGALGTAYIGVTDAAGSINNYSGSPANVQGYWLANRVVSTGVDAYVRAVSIGSFPVNSAGLDTVKSFLLGALRLTGTVGDFSTDQVTAATVGAGLTAPQITALYNAIQAFLTSYGTQV